MLSDNHQVCFAFNKFNKYLYSSVDYLLMVMSLRAISPPRHWAIYALGVGVVYIAAFSGMKLLDQWLTTGISGIVSSPADSKKQFTKSGKTKDLKYTSIYLHGTTSESISVTPGSTTSTTNVSDEMLHLFRILYEVGVARLETLAGVHSRVYCSFCQAPIVGVRYSCTICGYLNICQSCEVSSLHPRSHPLYVIPHALPRAVVVHRLSTQGIPWRSRASIESRDHEDLSCPGGIEDYVDFQTIKYDDGRIFQMNISQISAMYVQFMCLVDKRIPADSTLKHPCTFQSAISMDAFRQLLPLKIGVLSDPLDILANFYDLDKDGCISFSDFVQATDILLNQPYAVKLDRFLECVVESTMPSAENTKLLFADLFSAYVEACKISFRKAVNLMTFDKGKYTLSKKVSSPECQSKAEDDDSLDNLVQKHLDSLLYEPRIELDPSMAFDPNAADSTLDAQISLSWHISAGELVEQMFHGIPLHSTTFMDTLRQRLLLDMRFKGCVTSLLESAVC